MNKLRKMVELLEFLCHPRKDIEIFGMFGPGNLGDEAMLFAALENISRSRCVTWKSYQNSPFLNKLIEQRRRDHLLVIGGTLIHGGETDWLDYIEHRSNQGVKVSFFGTGVSFTDEQVKSHPERIYRWTNILARSDEVHLRGTYSVEQLKEFGINADVFGDFAVLLYDKEIPVTAHETRTDTIGLNLGNCLSNQAVFEESCITLVRLLKERYRLVFHVVVNSDIEATYRVIEKADLSEAAYAVEQHYFNPRAFMTSIRNYKAFIGLKLHAAGIAMIAGVPTLMIAYLPKCRDFMAPLGEPEDLLIDLPLDIDEVTTKLDKLLSSPRDSVLTSSIEKISSYQKQRLERFCSQLIPK